MNLQIAAAGFQPDAHQPPPLTAMANHASEAAAVAVLRLIVIFVLNGMNPHEMRGPRRFGLRIIFIVVAVLAVSLSLVAYFARSHGH